MGLAPGVRMTSFGPAPAAGLETIQYNSGLNLITKPKANLEDQPNTPLVIEQNFVVPRRIYSFLYFWSRMHHGDRGRHNKASPHKRQRMHRRRRGPAERAAGDSPLLKARQAVQTCVLATRWRHLWRSVPCGASTSTTTSSSAGLQRHRRCPYKDRAKEWEEFEDFTGSRSLMHGCNVALLDSCSR